MLHCPNCGRHYADELQVCPEDGTMLQADATLVSNAPIDPLVGRILDGKYKLDVRLGEGGMGTVYRATHLLIERPVAVKVLNTRFVTDEAARERFRREARAAGRLQHTNAVAVTDFGETPDGFVYIVMELLEGRSLRDVLALEAPFDTARAVSLMLQISAAVAAAHEAGIIHRDLKPGNIFVVERPHAPAIVKVLDFGIAKLALEKTDGVSPVTLTEAGVMIGTPRYMSPEQCDGAELKESSDVYSLGIILYEMLAGAPPFTGLTPLAVALKHSSEMPRSPREIVANIPLEIEEVVLHALEKKPAQRPPDAGAFRRELYSVAERLGLEHAAGFSAPTLENLRGAGTETPSGRLLIDIERLREQRAASFAATTTEIVPGVDTAQDRALQTGGSSAGKVLANAAAPVPANRSASRVRVPLVRREAWREWYTQPANLALVCVAGLLLAVGIVALVSAGRNGSSNSMTATEDDEAMGRVLSPADVKSMRHAAPQREPASAAEFYERGAYNFSVREYDAAANDFRRALELQKDFPSAHNRLGQTLMVKGQFAAAASEFRTAIEQKGGTYPAAQYNLGFALQQQNDARDALEAYQSAIQSRGGSYSDAYYQTGMILLGQRRYTEASEALRKAIEQNAKPDPDAQFALGTALAFQQDYTNAEPAFRQAIEARGGNFPEAHYNLGLLYDKAGRPADAVKEYETYLQQRPNATNRRLVENSLRDLRRRAANP
ncbi:MAG: protein kinase [Pyrinomonadaceae bacterium]